MENTLKQSNAEKSEETKEALIDRLLKKIEARDVDSLVTDCGQCGCGEFTGSNG